MKLFQRLQAQLVRYLEKSKSRRQDQPYFQAARSWADDVYLSSLVSRNRYQLAFFIAMGYAGLTTLALGVAVFTKQVYLVAVHENPSGFNYVTLEKQSHAPALSKAEIESDIAHYIVARESYHPATYSEQSKRVENLSSSQINAEYQLAQSKESSAPIHILQNKGYRKVMIKSIIFLDNRNAQNTKSRRKHENLAEVNFVVSDSLFGRDNQIKTPYTALVSWHYRGTPQNIEAMWQNWRGFEVTTYQVNPVNVHNNPGE